jgi:hypothetical protein
MKDCAFKSVETDDEELDERAELKRLCKNV